MSREQSPQAQAPASDEAEWQDLIRPIIGVDTGGSVRVKDITGKTLVLMALAPVTAESTELLLARGGVRMKIVPGVPDVLEEGVLLASEVISLGPCGLAAIFGASASRATSRAEPVAPPKSPWQRMVDSFMGKPCKAKYRIMRGSTAAYVRLVQAPADYNGQFVLIEDCEEVVINRNSDPALFAVCAGAATAAAVTAPMAAVAASTAGTSDVGSFSAPGIGLADAAVALRQPKTAGRRNKAGKRRARDAADISSSSDGRTASNDDDDDDDDDGRTRRVTLVDAAAVQIQVEDPTKRPRLNTIKEYPRLEIWKGRLNAALLGHKVANVPMDLPRFISSNYADMYARPSDPEQAAFKLTNALKLTGSAAKELSLVKEMKDGWEEMCSYEKILKAGCEDTTITILRADVTAAKIFYALFQILIEKTKHARELYQPTDWVKQEDGGFIISQMMRTWLMDKLETWQKSADYKKIVADHKKKESGPHGGGNNNRRGGGGGDGPGFGGGPGNGRGGGHQGKGNQSGGKHKSKPHGGRNGNGGGGGGGGNGGGGGSKDDTASDNLATRPRGCAAGDVGRRCDVSGSTSGSGSDAPRRSPVRPAHTGGAHSPGDAATRGVEVEAAPRSRSRSREGPHCQHPQRGRQSCDVCVWAAVPGLQAGHDRQVLEPGEAARTVGEGRPRVDAPDEALRGDVERREGSKDVASSDDRPDPPTRRGSVDGAALGDAHHVADGEPSQRLGPCEGAFPQDADRDQVCDAVEERPDAQAPHREMAAPWWRRFTPLVAGSGDDAGSRQGERPGAHPDSGAGPGLPFTATRRDRVSRVAGQLGGVDRDAHQSRTMQTFLGAAGPLLRAVEPVDVEQVDGMPADGGPAAGRTRVTLKWATGEVLKLEDGLPRLKEHIRLVWDTGGAHSRVPVTLLAREDEPLYEWLPEEYDGSRSSAHAWRTGNGVYRREARYGVGKAVKKLPLAPICPPNFRYEALKTLFTEVAPSEHFLTLLTWMTTDALAERLANPPPYERRAVRDSPNIGDTEVEFLLSTRTVEVVPEPSTRGVVTAFKVPKGEAMARLVVDGRPFDDRLRAAGVTVPPMPKPGLYIRDVVDRLLHPRAKVIATVDAKSMFYQFAIPPSLRRYFVFNNPTARLDRDSSIRLTVLPMGISFAPSWAQHVSQFLVDVVRDRFPPADSRWWDAAVWIDNFIFVADGERTLAHLRSVFEAVAATVNLTLKPWEGGGHQLEVLGVALDVQDKTARITGKSRAVLEEFSQSLNHVMSVKAFLHFFGHAGFLTYAVARHPLCLIPRAMNHLRRIGRARGSLKTIALSDPDLTEARAWINYLTDAFYVMIPARYQQDEHGYATDASTTGLGIVDFTSLRVKCAQMRAEMAPTSIHLGEMAAGLIAAHACATEGAVWTTDNMTVFHALLRGHSGSEAIDEMLRVWISLAPVPRAVRWVPTSLQPADGLSRGDDPVIEELQKANWTLTAPVPIRWVVR
jgi:hypothetical protein